MSEDILFYLCYVSATRCYARTPCKSAETITGLLSHSGGMRAKCRLSLPKHIGATLCANGLRVYRLLPLTTNHGDEPCPKALLPIANKPMLEYPLAWLEQSGITGKKSLAPL